MALAFGVQALALNITEWPWPWGPALALLTSRTLNTKTAAGEFLIIDWLCAKTELFKTKLHCSAERT